MALPLQGPDEDLLVQYMILTKIRWEGHPGYLLPQVVENLYEERGKWKIRMNYWEDIDPEEQYRRDMQAMKRAFKEIGTLVPGVDFTKNPITNWVLNKLLEQFFTDDLEKLKKNGKTKKPNP